MRRVLLPVLVLAAVVLIYFAVTVWKGGSVERAGTADAEAFDASRQPVAAEQAQLPVTSAPQTAITNNVRQDRLLGTSPEDLQPIAENGEAFLAQHGANAFNFLAVFAASGDERFLRQALAKFPKEPAVLYVALADAPKGPERTSLIERFKAADPNNPLPWVFSAAELFEDGRRADAVEELREAIKRPGFYTYFNERAAALRELALNSGAGEYAAESLALFTQKLPHLSAATKAARGLSAFVDAQIGEGDDAAIRGNVKLLFDLGRMFQTPEAARLLVGQLVGVSMERKALEVAANLRENPLPVAAEPRAAELAQVRDEAKALADNAARVPAEPALWKGYFARFRTEGEIAALRWVQQQPQGSAASPSQPAAPVAGALKLK